MATTTSLDNPSIPILQYTSLSTSSSHRLFASRSLSLPSQSITAVPSPKSHSQLRCPLAVRASSTAGFNDNIGDVLVEVNIFSATGESAMFNDLWDQNELPFPLDCLYADPEPKAKVFPRFEALQKAVKKYTIEAAPDDSSSVLRQGGTFVFKGNQLLYARKD